MATDIILEIKGIKGESKIEKGFIDVVQWDWGMANRGSQHDQGGGGTGKGEVQDLTVTKYVDSATPNLMLACCTGDHLDEATLTLRKSGGKKALEYLVIKMTKVFISNVQTGSAGDDDRFTENVSLNFAKVDISYTPQDDKGGGKGSVDVCYNIEEAKEC
jgi:type VI secretion system secreted protein Hcp